MLRISGLLCKGRACCQTAAGCLTQSYSLPIPIPFYEKNDPGIAAFLPWPRSFFPKYNNHCATSEMVAGFQNGPFHSLGPGFTDRQGDQLVAGRLWQGQIRFALQAV